MIHIAELKETTNRGWDSHGGGHFKAPRGAKLHKGVDKVCPAGALVVSPVGGVVTKLGYPYADSQLYRYIEVTDGQNRKHRLFYVQPVRLNVGDEVERGEFIGVAQNIEARYPGITPHIHYEVMAPTGEFLDPDRLNIV